MILTEEDFIKGISILSTSEFDSFLKYFSQFLNLQIANDINQVLQFCGFYLKSWESLDEEHCKFKSLSTQGIILR